MRALKLTGPGNLEIVDVPIPEPGPGEVRVKIAGAGLCHSDLHVLEMGESWPAFGLTMGHEGAGIVDALGPGVSGPAVGAPVVVNLLWNCGRCRACYEGRENACVLGGRTGFPPTPGLGPDGAMAEYMISPARNVVPISGLDPVDAGPLVDAGLTPMHAINSARDWLTPGSTAVVMGIGGLGHVGLQIIKATTAARIIAVDTDPAKLALATDLGADRALLSDGDAAASILAESNGYGVDAVFDFAGVQPTVDLGVAVIAPEGVIRLVGLGGGRFPLSAVGDGSRVPWGVNVQRSYGGTVRDQAQVLALAEQGKVHIETTTYPLDDFQRAIDDLYGGRVLGRAILIP